MKMSDSFRKQIADTYGVDLEGAPSLHVTKPITISAASKEAQSFMHMIKPRDLHHLKELIGVPNRVHEANGTIGKEHLPEQVHPGQLPRMTAKGQLSAAEEAKVRAMAKNLLIGHAPEELLSDPNVKAVADYMLQRAKAVPVAALSDVVVRDGETLKVENSTLTCGTLTVYGSGQVLCAGTAKIVAERVEHVPNPS